MKVNKSYFKSKTLWVSLIVAVAPFFPEAQELIAAKPEMVGAVVGAVFGFLRIITGKPLGLEDSGLK